MAIRWCANSPPAGSCAAFPRNAGITNEGDKGKSLFVIVSGRVKVYVSDDNGREMILDVHGTVDYVGEMALDGRVRSASAVTLEPSACSVVTRDEWRDMISRIFKDLTIGGYVTVDNRAITIHRKPPSRW